MNSSVLNAAHRERICWGCSRYCGAHELACGNGTIRTPHPLELFGEDWLDWSKARDSTRGYRRCRRGERRWEAVDDIAA